METAHTVDYGEWVFIPHRMSTVSPEECFGTTSRGKREPLHILLTKKGSRYGYTDNTLTESQLHNPTTCTS